MSMLNRSTNEVATQRFLSALSPDQKKSVRDHHRFEVVSDLGNRWVIRTDTTIGNVYALGAGLQFCTAFLLAALDEEMGYPPPGDLYLAQALVLRTDEAYFMRVASFLGANRNPYQ